MKNIEYKQLSVEYINEIIELLKHRQIEETL